MILRGTVDGAVPVVQARDLEAALLLVPVDVDTHYYEGGGHNLAGEPGIHDDLVDRIAGFVCEHFYCP